MVEDDVVGFDEEAQTIVNRLLQKSGDLEVIPVAGMLGLGKTTLAHKIFWDTMVRQEFKEFIWIAVSQRFDRRKVLLNIISILDRDAGQYQDMADDELADKIRQVLIEKRYLIVLDDVWASEALKEIISVLPKNSYGSKVLLTTRDTNVANTCNEQPHHLKFLSDDECWQLLQKKISRKCPPESEPLGKDIAKRCNGLPLTVVLISGILNRTGRTRNDYERVLQSLSEGFILKELEICKNLIRTSYDTLPLNLKLCFLYCGAFPLGFEIPTWKLLRLWISEGFIQNRMTSTLEIVAAEHLKELVDKNFLIVTKKTSDGQIKTCCVHDMLHEFCRQEASEENLFQVIKLGIEQSFPRNQELATYRRLCICSSMMEFLSAKPLSEYLRSFLCFSLSKSDEEITRSEAANIPKAFPLLRVLDVESIKFNDVSPKFSQLFHLRYLAFSIGSTNILPKIIGDLWNLQTLIVMTTEGKTLNIEVDILNMPQLRHFHTNASAKLHLPTDPKKEIFCTLQTLSTIEPESCKEHVFARSQKLTKLGIRGKIAVFSQNITAETSSKVPSSKFNDQLKCLENLKLRNDDPPVDGMCLPPNLFPATLKKLTLSVTWLKWADMCILEDLPALEVLKLKQHAFKGNSWESKKDGFPCLKVLLIETTDLVTWKASDDVFPSLERLVLKDCKFLEEVPLKLAAIYSLQELKLENTTSKAAKCAREIQVHSKTAFKLSIIPPISDSN